MSDAVKRWNEINAKINNKAKLIVVSKMFGATDIWPLINAGQCFFGENRVQDASLKWPDLRHKQPNLELHLIGPLQSNKVADAVALFDVIQTVDRPKIAEALAKEIKKQNKQLKFFIQVNIGQEPQKAGVDIENADAFIQTCRRDLGLNVAGLMCIPPFDADGRPYFKQMVAIARRNGLLELSMGMSGDYMAAIDEGATMVRVGSAIFGTRAQITNRV